MGKNNIKFAFTVLISALIPLWFQFVLGESAVLENTYMYTFLWILSNYLFISTIMEIWSNYRQMFKLKGLNINKSTFIVNIAVYILFLVFINCYFIQTLYIRDNYFLNKFASLFTLSIILMTFIINLMCGAFPSKSENENTNVYSVDNNNSFRYGRDMWRIVIGSYEEGIVIGYLPFKYSDIKTVFLDKKSDELTFKGKNENGQFRVAIKAPKSKNQALEIIKEAEKNNKIESSKINL
ncbi:hypothetical protein [Anaerosphaera multitolerans]|uniref:Uncharacterized protein n=1 Tax=Anaerosphaera multitolerans TaxID=2487351 RepID=A0A437S8X9_9FIRM|nr:hypothetical protein [Anaerosphaera multitolerans]RVU55559.1 hypothetical protein EF514_02185 [Anaerosphaera multitolerans]